MIIETIIKEAKVLGAKAFKSGEDRTPVKDNILIVMLESNDIDTAESAPVYKTWLRAWDFEKIKKTDLTDLEEGLIVELCETLGVEELEELFAIHNYTFDENESTSINIRLFAEQIDNSYRNFLTCSECASDVNLCDCGQEIK